MPTRAVRWPTDSLGGLHDRRCVSWSRRRLRHRHGIRHQATRLFGAPTRVVLVARAARAARAAARTPHRNAATDAERALARPGVSGNAKQRRVRDIGPRLDPVRWTVQGSAGMETVPLQHFFVSGRQDLNLRPPGPPPAASADTRRLDGQGGRANLTGQGTSGGTGSRTSKRSRSAGGVSRRSAPRQPRPACHQPTRKRGPKPRSASPRKRDLIGTLRRVHISEIPAEEAIVLVGDTGLECSSGGRGAGRRPKSLSRRRSAISPPWRSRAMIAMSPVDRLVFASWTWRRTASPLVKAG
jgi:hypothetical protein